MCIFFQAEDGIRDLTVTGVQTCALPIYCRDSWRGDAEESFRPPAPFRRGIPRARLHVAFCFQPIERGIDGADRNFSLRSEEHTSELQSQSNLVCRLLLEKKKTITHDHYH